MKHINIFVAELIGTFGLVAFATGSIVIDGMNEFMLGHVFIACVHFIGLFVLVLAFGKYSMAHFNPIVTVGFLISNNVKLKIVPVYFLAQTIGAISGSLFVKFVLGNHAKLGLNFPDLTYTIGVIYGVEILASLLLMGVILLVVRRNILVVSAAVAGIVSLDVFFLGPISGASMNPIRSLAPALVTGIYDHLWIYWTAPFLGAIFIAILYKITNNATHTQPH